MRMRPKSEPVDPQTAFHVLFNADGGPVQECMIEASCLLECESRLKELHPEAVYWEIGVDDCFAAQVFQELNVKAC